MKELDLGRWLVDLFGVKPFNNGLQHLRGNGTNKMLNQPQDMDPVYLQTL